MGSSPTIRISYFYKALENTAFSRAFLFSVSQKGQKRGKFLFFLFLPIINNKIISFKSPELLTAPGTFLFPSELNCFNPKRLSCGSKCGNAISFRPICPAAPLNMYPELEVAFET